VQAKFVGVGERNNQAQLVLYKVIFGWNTTKAQVKSRTSCMTAAGDVLAVLKTADTSMGVKQEKELVQARTASPSKICLDESKSWLQYKQKCYDDIQHSCTKLGNENPAKIADANGLLPC
jgi:hypothetical protein